MEIRLSLFYTYFKCLYTYTSMKLTVVLRLYCLDRSLAFASMTIFIIILKKKFVLRFKIICDTLLRNFTSNVTNIN